MDIQKKLDLIAKHINELDTYLKSEYGSNAFVYFESEGRVYAMTGDDNKGSSYQRQKHVIESSKYAQFDCGAW